MGGGREGGRRGAAAGGAGSTKRDGAGRGAVGSLGRKRKVKAFPSLVVLSPPGVCAGDNGQTG